MALPNKLKNFILFGYNQSYQGVVSEVTLPKLTIKTDGMRTGGMLGEVMSDVGIDPQPIEWKAPGFMREPLWDFGVETVDGVPLRFVGAYQDEKTGRVLQAELIVRGRHTEIDPGSAKGGDGNDFGVTTHWTYLKWTVNGVVDVEIDLLGMIFVTGGIDRMAAIRTALLS